MNPIAFLQCIRSYSYPPPNSTIFNACLIMLLMWLSSLVLGGLIYVGHQWKMLSEIEVIGMDGWLKDVNTVLQLWLYPVVLH